MVEYLAIPLAVQSEYLFRKEKADKPTRSEHFRKIIFYINQKNESKFFLNQKTRRSIMKTNKMPDELKRFNGPDDEEDEEETATGTPAPDAEGTEEVEAA